MVFQTVPVLINKEYKHDDSLTKVYRQGWSATNKMDVDSTMGYEASIWVKNDDAGVRTYFGFYCYDKTGAQIHEGMKNDFGSTNGGAWSNPYFYTQHPGDGLLLNKWTKITARLFPADATVAPADQKIGKAGDQNWNPAMASSIQYDPTGGNSADTFNYYLSPACAQVCALDVVLACLPYRWPS